MTQQRATLMAALLQEQHSKTFLKIGFAQSVELVRVTSLLLTNNK